MSTVVGSSTESKFSRSLWGDAWRRLTKHRLAVVSFYFIIFMTLVAVFAPEIAPYSFDEQNMSRVLEGPTKDHILGTDDLGRDLFSRLIYGARMSMAVGIITAIISLFLGTIYGAIAGWCGGRIDSVLMRFIDILDSIPTVVLLILVKLLFDAVNVFSDPETRALFGILMALSVFGWIMLARVVRGQVMQVKQLLYVESAHALGASNLDQLVRHVLPNILGPIIVVLTFQIPSNIMFESFLSFIGLGLQPPFSSWGVLANTGWKTISTYPHLIIAPSVALFVTMLAFNLLGDGLRDAFDPKLK
jgi:oligopeptide transport system permease protein